MVVWRLFLTFADGLFRLGYDNNKNELEKMKRIYQQPIAVIIRMKPNNLLGVSEQGGTKLEVTISGYEEDNSNYGFSQSSQ